MRIGIQSSGTTGDMRPFIQLAAGLSKANVDVTLVLTTIHKNNLLEYCKRFDFRTIIASDEECYRNADKLRNLDPDQMSAYLATIDRHAYVAAEKLCRENDLVIGNQAAYYLHAPAEKQGIPYITMSLNHALIPSKHRPFIAQGLVDLGEELNQKTWLEVQNTINAKYEGVTEFRKHYNLGPVDNFFNDVLHSPELHLIGVSKVFCEEHPDWKNHRHVCGYFFLEDVDSTQKLPDSFMKFIHVEDPPIFFSLGSSNYFISNLVPIINDAIRAAKTVNKKIIIQTTWHSIDPAELEMADHVLQLPMDIDHRLILPHCAVMIHHGGSGTSHTTILCECPSITIEDGGDMSFWAYLLHVLGVSPPSISRVECTYELLVDRLTTVLSSPQMKANAVRLSKIMQTENPVKTAIAAIQSKFAFNSKRHYMPGNKRSQENETELFRP